MSADPYEALGVSAGVSDAELRRAYLRLARQHHPDSQPAAKRASAERRMQEINAAWAKVSDATRRAAHDRSVRAGAGNESGGGGSADYDDDRRRWMHDPNDPHWTSGAGAGALDDDLPITRVGTPGQARPLAMVPPALFLTGLGLTIVSLVVSFGPGVTFGIVILLLSAISFLVVPFLDMARSRQQDQL